MSQEQIVTAIELFFSEKSSCSVHTLIAASLGILRDILRSQKKEWSMNIEQYARAEMLNEFRQIIRKQQNFFKHANKDPKGTLKLNERLIEAELLESVNAYETLYEVKTYNMMIYQFWFMCAHPKFYPPNPPIIKMLESIGFNPEHFTKGDALTLLKPYKSDDELENRL
jgi:hypothetical protein